MVLDEHILILDKLLVSSLQITLALVRKVNLYRSLMSTSDSIVFSNAAMLDDNYNIRNKPKVFILDM